MMRGKRVWFANRDGKPRLTQRAHWGYKSKIAGPFSVYNLLRERERARASMANPKVLFSYSYIYFFLELVLLWYEHTVFIVFKLRIKEWKRKKFFFFKIKTKSKRSWRVSNHEEYNAVCRRCATETRPRLLNVYVELQSMYIYLQYITHAHELKQQKKKKKCANVRKGKSPHLLSFYFSFFIFSFLLLL